MTRIWRDFTGVDKRAQQIALQHPGGRQLGKGHPRRATRNVATPRPWGQITRRARRQTWAAHAGSGVRLLPSRLLLYDYVKMRHVYFVRSHGQKNAHQVQIQICLYGLCCNGFLFHHDFQPANLLCRSCSSGNTMLAGTATTYTCQAVAGSASPRWIATAGTPPTCVRTGQVSASSDVCSAALGSLLMDMRN
jgi:hypothetical protein